MKRKAFSWLLLLSMLVLFASCHDAPSSAESSTQSPATKAAVRDTVTSDGTAAALLSGTLMRTDARYLTYEEAAGDTKINRRIPIKKEIGPYPIRTIAYVEEEDTLFIFAVDESIDDGMVHEKVLIESYPLPEEEELIKEYPTLTRLQKDWSFDKIGQTSFSVFHDGYEINCINGDYVYRIVVNSDKELLQETIDVLQ